VATCALQVLQFTFAGGLESHSLCPEAFVSCRLGTVVSWWSYRLTVGESELGNLRFFVTSCVRTVCDFVVRLRYQLI
jgi:hypothetical protein